MKRSKWKAINLTDNPQRSRIITPEMLLKTIEVWNGRESRKLKINVDHVNHRLGEFSHTKVTPRFKKKNK